MAPQDPWALRKESARGPSRLESLALLEQGGRTGDELIGLPATSGGHSARAAARGTNRLVRARWGSSSNSQKAHICITLLLFAAEIFFSVLP